jgi:hypothetical protein
MLKYLLFAAVIVGVAGCNSSGNTSPTMNALPSEVQAGAHSSALGKWTFIGGKTNDGDVITVDPSYQVYLVIETNSVTAILVCGTQVAQGTASASINGDQISVLEDKNIALSPTDGKCVTNLMKATLTYSINASGDLVLKSSNEPAGFTVWSRSLTPTSNIPVIGKWTFVGGMTDDGETFFASTDKISLGITATSLTAILDCGTQEIQGSAAAIVDSSKIVVLEDKNVALSATERKCVTNLVKSTIYYSFTSTGDLLLKTLGDSAGYTKWAPSK